MNHLQQFKDPPPAPGGRCREATEGICGSPPPVLRTTSPRERGKDLRASVRRQRGNTLIGMLVVVAIIAVMAVMFLGGKGDSLGVGESSRADGKGRTVLGAAKASAQDDVCRSNLGQIRASIQIQTTTDDEKPASLASLPGMSSVSSCPIGKEPYTYDPATAVVKCPHPGHGKY